MKYMLDTNICIYLIKHQPPQVAEKFAQCHSGDVVISSITLSELFYGVEVSGERKDQNEKALANLLKDIPPVPYDDIAAASYGPVRKACPSRQKNALDKLIAAHAISLDLILVTNNEKDFKEFPNLTTENWVVE